MEHGKKRLGLTKLDRRLGFLGAVARLGHLWTETSRRGLAQHIRGSSSLTKWLYGRRQHQPPIHFGWNIQQTRSSPCTRVVVPRRQCQVDAPESVERESGACVELLEDAGELGGGLDELSASAWHGARPASWYGRKFLGGLFGRVEFKRPRLPFWGEFVTSTTITRSRWNGGVSKQAQ
jgi:hypothetical protein